MTENIEEKSAGHIRSPMRRALVLILAISFVAGLAALIVWYLINRPQPSTGLGVVELGMREMDVTLAYGRSPDCKISESETTKEWGYYQGEECGAKLFFRNDGSGFRLTRICGAGITDSVNYGDDEKDVLRKLGSPSFVTGPTHDHSLHKLIKSRSVERLQVRF